jgi:hypothetical protein
MQGFSLGKGVTDKLCPKILSQIWWAYCSL